jgi:8-oxo-dGTP diphosphatase
VIYFAVVLQVGIEIDFLREYGKRRPDISDFLVIGAKLDGESKRRLIQLSRQRKMQLARIVRFSPVRQLMSLGVRMTVPRHRTGVVIVGYNGEGQILMLRHVFHPFAPWGLPGGWLEKGEAPADCAIRELSEETGLSAELGPIVYSSFESVPPHIGIAFMASINPARIKLSAEIIDAAWFEPPTLPEPLLPFVRNAINAANQRMDLLTKTDRGKRIE